MTRLIPSLTDDERAAVVAAGMELLFLGPYGKAVRFRHQGRTVRGIDCIGTAVWAYSRGAGVLIADRTDYGKLPAHRKLRETMELHFDVSLPLRTELQTADLLSMAWGAEEAHLAMVVPHPDGLGLLHAYADAGCVIWHRLTHDHMQKVNGVYR